MDPDVDVFHAKECVYRIFRDVRFSKDKSPYKTHFGAFIAPGGRKSPYAGYYFQVDPEESFLGGGAYMPQSPYLKAIRKEIFEHPSEYKKIINSKKFKEYFNEIYGEKLKTAPRDFPKDWPDIDLIRNKHYAATHHVDADFWRSGNIHDEIIKVLKVQYPFNKFLNGAIARV